MAAPLEATMFAITPDRLHVGSRRSKVWPHVSVMPWVKLGDHTADILNTASQIAKDVGDIILEPGEMVTVGAPGFEKSAQCVESEELRELHRKLLGALGSFGISVSHPEWAGEYYFPHITSPQPVFEEPFAVSAVQVIENRQFVRGIGTKVVIDQLRVGV